ncbi:MAG: hypothetical protein P4L85_07425 [Paludisphaera borealis]|uniref:hypothetical protein n=1 Tax=Paludisphaera borealis TaxID=1387353 RepID=UPI00284B19AB|nr:hypothetical protein [Paludisphaera borealis]MDR3619164.1 hypothetical protein [Paludisphaera borealis]
MIGLSGGARGRIGLVLACLVALVLPSGCAFGPKLLEKTHGRYQEAIRTVGEEQLLRNIVHMRYNETPLNLNVSSIASQYELAGGAQAQPFFVAPNPSNSNVIFKTFTSILPNLNVSGANRPTITLLPADDGDAVRQFMTPAPPETLAFLIETSWPPSVILRLWVERLNGVPNAVTASGPQRAVISDFRRFQRATELIQESQTQEWTSLRVEEHETVVGGPLPIESSSAAAAVDAAKSGVELRAQPDGMMVLVRKGTKMVVRINPRAVDRPEVVELMELLNLEPGRLAYDVVVAPGVIPDPMRYPRSPSSEIRVMTRSASQVMYYLANGVEVPEEHLSCGLVKTQTDDEGDPIDGRELTQGLFEVHCGKGHKPPPCAFVAISYRGYWYYIDDRDHASKSTLALMLQLGRLDFGNKAAAAPFLTLPIGR